MAILSPQSGNTPNQPSGGKKMGFFEAQEIKKQKANVKAAAKKKIPLQQLTVFIQQLASMLDAGLPLVGALDALQDQTENPIFKIIIRNVRNDIAGGTTFSEALRKYPRAFPNLFISMVEAGEASGGLAPIMDKVGDYFESMVKLAKKVKSAMVYPAVIITVAITVVVVLMVWVIPIFAELFAGFGKELPTLTQFVIDASHFLGDWILLIIGLCVGAFFGIKHAVATPRGRIMKDRVINALPLIGGLIQKINMSRFTRTYAILMRSGVPILRALEICSSASGSTYVEDACVSIAQSVTQGGQISDAMEKDPYFPSMVKHMTKAGEQTGNVDGMMDKVADFYDNEVDSTVNALTSLMEPFLIVFIGVVVGVIVIAMFLPIFNLSSVVG